MALTAMKLLLPEATAPARAWLRSAVGRDYDYVSAFRRLGEDIAEVFAPEEGEELRAALYEPVTIAELREETASKLPKGTVPAGEVAETMVMPEAVEAFLSAQAEYSEYAVPANVSYDMPELPFQYGTPLSGVKSSGFGFRVHPIESVVKFHFGTDFAADTGTGIQCFAYGSVSAVGYDAKGYGNYVVIDHGSGWKTLYGHCSKILVETGEYVWMGQTIAKVGETGEATGPHLHFELTGGGICYNPEFYLAG